MKLPLLVLALLAAALPRAIAAEPLAVPDAGMMGDIPGAHELPDPALDYKIVFDVQTLAGAPGDVDPALQAMAGLINTFRHDGVPASHMHLVAMFHGRTIVLVANDQTYSQRTHAGANPNIQILRHLRDAGLLVTVCGQSAREQHYEQQSLLPFVQTNLSATVTFINLETRGYIRITE
ncbi:DsrE family protein [Lichenicola sp.]|uniref:DsrE family protein n=1 Tax=Lichenicola sp. TaxID=2804529 RepID=UPI003AFF7000